MGAVLRRARTGRGEVVRVGRRLFGSSNELEGNGHEVGESKSWERGACELDGFSPH